MSKSNLSKSAHYAIHIKEHLPPRWSEWFEGCTIRSMENGDTLLSGPVADQSALHGLLAKVRDLNLTLISVAQVKPTQNEDGL